MPHAWMKYESANAYRPYGEMTGTYFRFVCANCGQTKMRTDSPESDERLWTSPSWSPNAVLMSCEEIVVLAVMDS